MKNTNIVVAIFFVLLGLNCVAAAVSSCSLACASGLSCCADQSNGNICYNPATSSCLNGTVLCAAGDEACGRLCYDTTEYLCCNNLIYPLHKSQCAIPAACRVQATTPAPTTSAPTTTRAPTVKVTPYPTPAPPSSCGNGEYQPGVQSCVLSYDVTAFGVGKDGRLGVGQKTLTAGGIAQKPTLVPNITGDSIISVQTAPGHTAVLTYANRLYVTGQNSYGELGLGKTSTPVYSLEYLFFFDNLAPIVAYACGLKHTIVVLGDNSVYGFGSNSNGQLGVSASNKGNFPTPTLIPTIAGLKSGEQIVGTAVGFLHSLIWSNQKVWAFGAANEMQVGSTASSVPRVVFTAPSGDTIASCSAGGYASFIVTGSGAVYALGGGEYGLLGTGNSMNVGTPTLLTALSGVPINQTSVSQQHSMFLSSGSPPVLYAAGLNTCGELGLGTVNSGTSTPTRVTFFDGIGESIQGIASAFAHSIVYTDKNLYVFGCNEQFQLGLSQTGSSPYIVSTPKAHPYYAGDIILTANAKGAYSFVVSESAEVVSAV